MSRESLGPLQLSSLTVEEANRLFKQVQERIDTLFGLRGVVTIRDRIRAGVPVNDGDVVVHPVANSSLPSVINATTLDSIDSTGFLILAGQSGGQTASGGTGASQNLTLKSTAHTTKGAIIISDLSPLQWKDINGTVIHQFGA